MLNNLRQYLGLGKGDRRLLVECWWELLLAAIRVRLFPHWLSAPRNPGPPTSSYSVPNILRYVNVAASRHFKHMSCLERAVAGQRVLMRHGWPSQIEIGVRREAGTLEAHAWLCVSGERYDTRADEFVPMRPVHAVPDARYDR